MHSPAFISTLLSFFIALVSAAAVPDTASSLETLSKRGGEVFYLANCLVGEGFNIYRASYVAYYSNVDNSQNQQNPDAISQEYRDANGGYLHWEEKEQDLFFPTTGFTIQTHIAGNAQALDFGAYAGFADQTSNWKRFSCYTLKLSASALGNVADKEKDWHPRADSQVLDLVHPSLFCAVYDRAQCWDTMTEPKPPKVLEQPDEGLDGMGVLRKTLLASDWESHPAYPSPGWKDREKLGNEEYVRRWELHEEDKFLELPTVDSRGYKESGQNVAARKETYSIQRRKVQVIVKLAKIHLSPEKPDYAGGSWHVEGIANERIIASGICYYDCGNITDKVRRAPACLVPTRVQPNPPLAPTRRLRLGG
ncbi:hypothetical protein FRB90_004915 [Tulasnella sp. 427]|nr:hypothetical protein FRB90_004915 [Tulasnella sp. 427]